MKKILALMIGLTFFMSSVAPTFAGEGKEGCGGKEEMKQGQCTDQDKKETKKKKKAKKHKKAKGTGTTEATPTPK